MTIHSVELLCLTERAPILLRGNLEEVNDTTWIFESTTVVAVEVIDKRAIVGFPDQQSAMLTLRVTKQNGSLLTLSMINSHPREQRQYPRLFTPIYLALKPANVDLNDSWLNGEIPIMDSWIRPEPFMNFSINGVAFELEHPLEKDGSVWVALFVKEEPIYGIARVVRCSPKENSYDIALYFEELPTPAIEYLTELTLRLQDTLL